MSKDNKELGQSLIELLIAMSIFVVMVSSVAFLILDAYLSDRVDREKTIATFLIKEGMEATRSIRDNNWDDLTNGEHGLVLLSGKWVFQGNEEDISDYLEEGNRKIIVEEIDSNRKKVTSQVIWEITPARLEKVSFITYLTNWAQTTAPLTCASYCQSIGYIDGTCRRNAFWCTLNGETHEPGGDEYCTGGPQSDTCCCLP